MIAFTFWHPTARRWLGKKPSLTSLVVAAAVRASLWGLAVCWVTATLQADEPTPRPLPFPSELVEFGPASRVPLFTGGGAEAWDRDLRERGWIMREGGRWHLWYTGYNRAANSPRLLGYASSADGLNWTRSPANPLIGDAWVEDMCVVREGGRYVMVAEGEQDIAHLLTSADRVHWQRHGPLDIRLSTGAPIADGPRGTPVLWREHGLWHLFYERSDKGIWLATSSDLKVWTNVQDDPVMECGPAEHDSREIAFNQIVKHCGHYYAYYHASAQPGQWCSCIAASDDLRHWQKHSGNPVLPVDPALPAASSPLLVPDGNRHRLYTTHPDVRVRFSVLPVTGAAATVGSAADR